VVKNDLIAKIAHKTGIPKADVRLTVEALLEVIKEALAEDEKVILKGFGSFANKKRNKKLARSIVHNTALLVEACYVPTFKPAQAWVEKIKTSVKDHL